MFWNTFLIFIFICLFLVNGQIVYRVDAALGNDTNFIKYYPHDYFQKKTVLRNNQLLLFFHGDQTDKNSTVIFFSSTTGVPSHPCQSLDIVLQTLQTLQLQSHIVVNATITIGHGRYFTPVSVSLAIANLFIQGNSSIIDLVNTTGGLSLIL